MSCEVAHIIRRCDDAIVEAELHSGLRPEDLLLIERAWTEHRQAILRDLLARAVARREWPQSLHWDWSRKAAELKLLAADGWALQCGGQWQGVLMVKTSGYFAAHEQDQGKPLVYVDYLETAPWNWTYAQLGQEGEYKGIGQALFHKAVQHSSDQGFHGRVGLHGLPQAERFYELACGLTQFAKDLSKQNLVYFELSRDVAAKRLTMKGN